MGVGVGFGNAVSIAVGKLVGTAKGVELLDAMTWVGTRTVSIARVGSIVGLTAVGEPHAHINAHKSSPEPKFPYPIRPHYPPALRLYQGGTRKKQGTRQKCCVPVSSDNVG